MEAIFMLSERAVRLTSTNIGSDFSIVLRADRSGVDDVSI
jgi:hypothetical protein